MMWIVVLVMCCLHTGTVESQDCNTSEIIVGRLGKKLVFNFQLFDLRDESKKYITELFGKNSSLKEINIKDLKKESRILFKNQMDPLVLSANNRTEIFLTNDTFVVKKTELQKEDAGVYWIQFKNIKLRAGWTSLIIAGKPTIEGGSSPNPVLKAEDNYSTILQLECHSVSTSIGDCQLYNSMYIMWYKNGMRMTELDPTLSQINVTVDHNGGNFTCLATEYPPCYHRLQTTKHYDVLKIEDCYNVSESETVIVKPQYSPIDVKLEPDRREITVNKNEDLKVRCSAKCHPKCDVKWVNDYQDLKSNGLVTITESMFGSELKIININSSDEGVYSCLVNNTHGESEKNFTLCIKDKPTLLGWITPHNPVLKAEDNYCTILQLECHSVSTSIGDCQLYNSMYIMWYKNGMRMTELDPTLSQINVTVDHNGGNFMCLATEYPPCYHRLQTTKHVLNVEECYNVYESKTFIVKPQYAPIDVKLEPDQREITVNKNDDLKVRCSAKCRPKCDVKWEKDLQDLESNGLVTITKSMFGSELKIVNINSSDEGVYSCLVSNTHGKAKMNFTLSVRDRLTEKKVLMSSEMINVLIVATVVLVTVIIVAVIIVAVILVVVVIKYKKYQNKRTGLYEVAFLPRTSRINISRNGRQNQRSETVIYAELELNTPDGFRINGSKPEPEVQYSTIDFTKKAPRMPKKMRLDSDEE